MRRRRLQAKERNGLRRFLAGEISAAEACHHILGWQASNNEFLSEEDKKLLSRVYRETEDGSSAAKLIDKWHPDVLPAKLSRLEKLEREIHQQTWELCDRLLAELLKRKLDKKQRNRQIVEDYFSRHSS